MKELIPDRIKRLRTRKEALQGQVKALRAIPDLRNKEHKLNRLNDQVLTINDKIMELNQRP